MRNLINAAKRRLALLLGNYYAPTIETAERAVLTFAGTFAARAFGSWPLDIPAMEHVSYWQTAATAGVVAGVAVVQSALSTYFTGTPALLGMFSSTLRARRTAGRRPLHYVPLLRPREIDGKHERKETA